MTLSWVLGFAAVLLPGRRKTAATRVSLFFAALGGAFGLVLGVGALLQPTAYHEPLIRGAAVQGLTLMDFDVYIDPLAALFVMLICFFAVAISVYSYSFLSVDKKRIAAILNLYLCAMTFVVIVDNVFFFLVFWELMSLTSVYLVLYQHNLLRDTTGGRIEASAAGQDALMSPRVYLIASHVSTMFVTVALLWLALYAQGWFAGRGEAFAFRFQDLRAFAAQTSFAHSGIFILSFIGFAIKAGLIPFHFWLPYAHPTSPANIHALMSGVMIKVAIYIMLRMFFEFLGAGAWWWGALVMSAGACSAFLGVLYAIFNTNLKTALAYHSIENVGIIVVGLGLAMIFRSSGINHLAAFALIAALYHVINHAVFKGLLFLCTGAIEKLTTTVEMERLGGIGHKYRWTAFAFITGALAISGFPPLNGFVSEWLTVQAFLLGIGYVAAGSDASSASGLLPILQFASFILLVSAFALTAFCFVKMTASVFLGRPRDSDIAAAQSGRDVAWPMRGVLLLLASACFALGLFPSVVLSVLGRVAGALVRPGFETPKEMLTLTFVLPVDKSFVHVADLQILPLFACGAVICLSVYILIRLASRGRRPESATESWNCGTPFQPERMQLTEAAISFWILNTFGMFLRRERPERPPGGAGDEEEADLRDRFVVSQGVFVEESFRRAINFMLKGLRRGSTFVGLLIQNGDVRQYLLYIFIIILIVFFLLVHR